MGSDSEYLSERERDFLLDLARESLAAALRDEPLPEPDAALDSEVLSAPGAAFVSIYRDGELRGCIGTFARIEPLWRVVQNMTLMAASRDPRFGPIEAHEYPQLAFELSILTPPSEVHEVEDIEIGRDGLIISDDTHRGVLLPQVATKHQWTPEEFLSHTCIKASLPPTAWAHQKLNVQKFQAEIICDDDAPQPR